MQDARAEEIRALLVQAETQDSVRYIRAQLAERGLTIQLVGPDVLVLSDRPEDLDSRARLDGLDVTLPEERKYSPDPEQPRDYEPRGRARPALADRECSSSLKRMLRPVRGRR